MIVTTKLCAHVQRHLVAREPVVTFGFFVRLVIITSVTGCICSRDTFYFRGNLYKKFRIYNNNKNNLLKLIDDKWPVGKRLELREFQEF